jgi:hypothetical protein
MAKSSLKTIADSVKAGKGVMGGADQTKEQKPAN